MSTGLDGVLAELAARADEIPLADGYRVRASGERRRRRARVRLTAAASVVLIAVATVAGVGWLRRGDRPDPRPGPLPVATPETSASPVAFSRLTELGKNLLPLSSGDGAMASITGDRAMAVVHQQNGELKVGAIDLTNLRQAWKPVTLGKYDDWNGMIAVPGAAIVIGEHNDGSPLDNTMFVVDARTGAVRWKREFSVNGSDIAYFESALVLASGDSIVGLDWATGATRWTVKNTTTAALLANETSTQASSPSGTGRVYHDPRLIQLTDGAINVYDTRTGKQLAHQATTGLGKQGVAFDGRLYLASKTRPYRVQEYDLDHLDKPQTRYTSTDGTRGVAQMQPCGRGALCLLETTDDPDSSDRRIENRPAVTAVDLAAGRSLWHAEVRGAESMQPVGDRLLVSIRDITTMMSSDQIFDVTGKPLLVAGGEVRPINAHSALRFAAGQTSVSGLDLASGTETPLGTVPASPIACGWNDRLLVCPTEKGFGVWRFTSR